MTDKKDEALKLALEALSPWAGEDANHTEQYAAYHAIREALAEQPAQQQEPVAWQYNGILHEFDPSDWATGPVTPLYTSPPASKPWVGLTDEEIAELHHEIKVRLMGTYKTEDIYRAIEAKLKEKNG